MLISGRMRYLPTHRIRRPVGQPHILMRFTIPVFIAAALFLPSPTVVARETPATGGDVLFKARHHRGTGPCIPVGNGLARPIIDVFDVVDVVEGSLPKTVRSIQVRAMTGEVKDGKEGTVQVYRLTPSADTQAQLRAREKDRGSWLWVNATELKWEKHPR